MPGDAGALHGAPPLRPDTESAAIDIVCRKGKKATKKEFAAEVNNGK
ncbi:MAG: hypothetical protein J5501_04365 [Ruminococcus sp.]|nr:hypothetical protein [Ruminococcus sp.]